MDAGDGLRARRLDDEAAGVRLDEAIPVLFYVYGEPAGQTVARSVGRPGLSLAPHADAAGLHRGDASTTAARRRRAAARGGRPSTRRSAWSTRPIRPRPRGRSRTWPFVDSDARRRVGLERRRLDDAQSSCSATPSLPDRDGGRAGAGRAALRHDLPGALHGPAAGERAGYHDGSPINFADRLRGNLLVVHGSGDDNVHYQGTERLINALVAANRPFTMMVYPNRTHCICEGDGTCLHLFSLLTRYLEQNLPAGAR